MNSIRLPFAELREQAIALRRAGKSRREIKAILGVGSNQTLNEALAGEPPPEWTRRPRAKDGLRAKAASYASRDWTMTTSLRNSECRRAPSRPG